MKRLTVILFCAIAVSMCSNNSGAPTGRIALFYATISDYCTPEAIYCRQCKKEDGKFKCWIDIDVDVCASIRDVLSQRENAEIYFDYQAKYDDYPRTPKVFTEWDYDGWITPAQLFVIVDDIIKIEITALEDWNDNYPKGSDLSGIFTSSYQSPKPYIESGFTTDIRELLVCNVTDIPSNPIELLMLYTLLTTTELPTAEQPNVNVRYYFSSGNILECQTAKK